MNISKTWLLISPGGGISLGGIVAFLVADGDGKVWNPNKQNHSILPLFCAFPHPSGAEIHSCVLFFVTKWDPVWAPFSGLTVMHITMSKSRILHTPSLRTGPFLGIKLIYYRNTKLWFLKGRENTTHHSNWHKTTYAQDNLSSSFQLIF